MFRQTQAQQNAVNARCSSYFVEVCLSFFRLFFFFIFMSVCIQCVSNVYSNKPNYLLNMRRVSSIDERTHIYSMSPSLSLFLSLCQCSRRRFSAFFFNSPPRHFHFRVPFLSIYKNESNVKKREEVVN